MVLNRTGPMIVPNTGGAQSWQTVTVTNILLDAGPKVMSLVMDTNGPSGTVGNFKLFAGGADVEQHAPFGDANGANPIRRAFSRRVPSRSRPRLPTSTAPWRAWIFFAGNFSIGAATNAPFSILWTNVAAGNYVVVARATDNIGNTTYSVPITAYVISTVPQPALGSRHLGTDILCVWPTSAIGYNLEASTNLRPGSVWLPVTNLPVIQNGLQTVNLPTTNSSQYFRLKK